MSNDNVVLVGLLGLGWFFLKPSPDNSKQLTNDEIAELFDDSEIF